MKMILFSPLLPSCACDKTCVAEVQLLHIKRTPSTCTHNQPLRTVTGVWYERTVMHTSQTLRRRNSINRQTHAHIYMHSNPSIQPPTNHLIQKLWHRHTHTCTLKVDIQPCCRRFSIQLRYTGIYLLISVLAIRNTHLMLAAIVASLSATQCC